MTAIAIIGTGGMGNSHARRLSAIPGVKLTACCDIVQARAEEFARKWNIPAVYSDYHELLDREELDGVCNVTPDAAHAEVALAALRRGVHILSEKPLATSLADARKMAAAAAKAGMINVVNFSYRDSCGLQAAAKAVAAGKIGQVRHVEASYLQSWLVSKRWGDWRSSPALTWRLSTRHGSAGVLGDLGCHIYDLTTLLAGEIEAIHCRLETFDKGVPGNRLGPYVLDANDSFVSSVVFANGAIGTIHSTRWATGHLNSLRARVYGDEGAIEVDLDAGYDFYRICRGKTAVAQCAWKTVRCRPTPNNYVRFVRGIRTGQNPPNDFAAGARIQAYLHYSQQSDRLGRSVKVRL